MESQSDIQMHKSYGNGMYKSLEEYLENSKNIRWNELYDDLTLDLWDKYAEHFLFAKFPYKKFYNQITEQFILKHLKDLDLQQINESILSQKFIDNNFDLFVDSNKLNDLLKVRQFSKEFAFKHLDKFYWFGRSYTYTDQEIDKLKDYKIRWGIDETFYKNNNFSLEQIEKYKEYIDWNLLVKYNTNITLEYLLDKYSNYLDWDENYIYSKFIFTDQFIEKYKNKINWYKFSQFSKNLSINTIKKYYKRFDLYNLSYNYNLPYLTLKFVNKLSKLKNAILETNNIFKKIKYKFQIKKLLK